MKLFALDDLRLETLHAGDAPLMLPDFLPAPHIEPIIRLWWRALGQPRRVDLAWQSEGGPDRTMLKRLAQGALGNDVLVVVHVDDEHTHLDELRASDDLRALPKVALRCPSCAPGLSLRVLSELRRVVREALLSRWEEEGARLGLDPAALDPLEPLLRELLDPCDLVEAVNLAADRALAGVHPEALAEQVEVEVLRQQLKALPGPEAAAVLSRATAATVPAGQCPAAVADARLRVRGLLRDGALQGWSRRLGDHKVYSRIFEGWTLRDADPDPKVDAAQRVAARAAEAHAEVLRRRWADPQIEALADGVNSNRLSAAEAETALGSMRASTQPELQTTAAKADLHFIGGMIAVEVEDWAAAAVAFRESAAEAERGHLPLFSVSGWHRYGVAKYRLGEFEEAERALLHTLQLQVDHSWSPFERVFTLQDLAKVEVSRGDLTAAIRTLSQALAISTTADAGAPPWITPALWTERARVYRLSLDIPSAISDLANAVSSFAAQGRSKDHISALIELGRTLRDNGAWEQAEPNLSLAVTLSADTDDDRLRWWSLGELGIGLQRAGRNAEAAAVLRKALAKRVDEGSGGHAGQVSYLAMALAAQGLGTEARSIIDTHWAAHCNAWSSVSRVDISDLRGTIAERLGLRDEAITWFKRALDACGQEASPERRWILIQKLAHGYMTLKDASSAIKAMEDAEQLLGPPPTSLVANVCVVRAAAHCFERDFPEAELAARQGIGALEPGCENGPVWALNFCLAEALHHLGRFQEAVEVGGLARDLAPNDGDRVRALRSLAASLHALNKHGAANKAEREADQLSPKSRAAPRTQVVRR